MQTSDGKISVIMGVYNCEATLAGAIDSVLAQTYQNFRLIICDDCSEDGTYSVAEEYRRRHPEKIVLLKSREHSCLAATLNACLEKADGEFVARMDGDDTCAPDRFEKQVRFLRDNPGISLCGTAMIRTDSGGGQGVVIRCEEHPDRYTSHKGVPFCHATIMTYRSVYEALGGYQSLPRTVRCEDRDLWYRFFNAGFEGANLQEPLYRYLENSESLKRRSPRMRWLLFKTELYGYRLLGYPWYWYYKPVFNLCKALVPAALIAKYRKYQNKRNA